jgi:hypothetical protein
MATAASIRISPGDYSQQVTTLDAAITVVEVAAGFASVTVQPSAAAGCYVILEGAVQAAAIGVYAADLAARQSCVITGADCGSRIGGAFSFGVARNSSTDATISISGSRL